MLDWMFLMFIFLALIFLFLAIFIPEDRYEEPYWKLMFCILSTVLWFLLALSNLSIETAYSNYNATTGDTTLVYDPYINEGSIYFSYFYGLMGALCIIYTIILIFGYYYERMDDKNSKDENE
jgi:hypothetical protein